jgi:uncharacterized protein
MTLLAASLMSPSLEMNSVYMRSAPCCLHSMRNGGSLTSSIGARRSGKSGSSIAPILIILPGAKVLLMLLYAMATFYRVQLRTSTMLILYIAFLLGGMALGGVLSLALAALVLHITPDQLQIVLSNPGEQERHALMLLNTISQICTFLLSTLVFKRLFGDSDILPTRRVSWWYVLLPMCGIVTASPLIDWSGTINKLLIPAGSWLESIALPAEQHAERLMHLFLTQENTLELLFVVLAVALIPAICEEFAFRGVLQPLFIKAFRSPHVAVWITAFLFSAIHLQLYGFIPRLLLGALLGYLAVWSGSIWPSLTAHFANNSLGIASYYIMGGKLEGSSIPLPYSILLAGAFVMIIWLLYSRRRDESGSRRTSTDHRTWRNNR